MTEIPEKLQLFEYPVYSTYTTLNSLLHTIKNQSLELIQTPVCVKEKQNYSHRTQEIKQITQLLCAVYSGNLKFYCT